MRLQFGITGGLIVIAIVVLLLTGDGAGDNASFTGKPPQRNATPTISVRSVPSFPTSVPVTPAPWLQPPEWVAGSPETVTDFYFSRSILDTTTANIWHVTVSGRAPLGQPSTITVEILGWSPEGEALVGVTGGGRTLLYLGSPGNDLRFWIAIDGSDLRSALVSWSPDGKLIAVGAVISDAATGETVTALPAGSLIGWSADSRYYAVGGDPEAQFPLVLAWDRETGRLQEAALAVTGVWSSNGHRIAHESDRNGGTEPGLNQILITKFPDEPGVTPLERIEGVSARPLAWSYDDAYLAVAVAQPLSDDPALGIRLDEIQIIDTESGKAVAVIEGAWSPTWSPTDNALLFIGNICTGFDIFTVQANGTGLVNHTASENLDLWPIWSPDGRDVVHVAYRDESVTLVVRSIAAGTSRTLLSLPFDELSPISWSPDGKYITFRYGGGRGLCEGGVRQETAVTILS